MATATVEVGTGSRCTCGNSFRGDSARRTCVACGRLTATEMIAGDDVLDEIGASVFLPRIIAIFISGALTGVLAIAGAFTGAVTGALAGRTSDSGILRGAGLGAVAGAVLSIEILEASRSYWCSEWTTNAITSMISIPVLEMGEENVYDMFAEMLSKGLSNESLKKLPCHEITNERRGIHVEDVSCTICLQDFLTGEMARSLPLCSHTFHQPCIDKWLLTNGSCPVCRQFI